MSTLDWKDAGLCARVGHPDDWFVSNPNGFTRPTLRTAEKNAKATCQGCPVRDQCLQYALENGEEYGIWGALTPQERQQLVKGRAA